MQRPVTKLLLTSTVARHAEVGLTARPLTFYFEKSAESFGPWSYLDSGTSVALLT
jgi:hypothetical protein